MLSEAAFADFYRRHARALWTYAYRVTSNAADADDIVQESFIRFMNADLPGRTDEELRKYLFRIAANGITDRWRRSARERSRLEDVRQPPPAAAANADQDVTRTFAELKPRDRALLWLAYVEGEDHEHIAAALGVSRGSVKVLLSRAKARLRDLLRSRGLGVGT